jgi:hypothetical protein
MARMARTSDGSPQFATRCGQQAFEYGWDVRTLILNEAGTCQALLAASGQALVDRYMAMLEGLLTNAGAKLYGTLSNASGGAGSFGLIKEGGRQVIFLPLPHEVFSFAPAAAPSGLVLGWFLHTAPGWQWHRHRYDAADHPGSARLPHVLAGSRLTAG